MAAVCCLGACVDGTNAADWDDDPDGGEDRVAELSPGADDSFAVNDGQATTTSADPLADDDGDGIPNGVDNCPVDANPNQLDFNGDGAGNACDPVDYTTVFGNVSTRLVVERGAFSCERFVNLDVSSGLVSLRFDDDASAVGVDLRELAFVPMTENCSLSLFGNVDIEISELYRPPGAEFPVSFPHSLAEHDAQQFAGVTDGPQETRLATLLNVWSPGVNTGGFEPFELPGSLPAISVESGVWDNGQLSFSDSQVVLAEISLGGGSLPLEISLVGASGWLELKPVDDGGADPDSDGDGVPDSVDNCPSDANPNQLDFNGDGEGNVCDPIDFALTNGFLDTRLEADFPFSGCDDNLFLNVVGGVASLRFDDDASMVGLELRELDVAPPNDGGCSSLFGFVNIEVDGMTQPPGAPYPVSVPHSLADHDAGVVWGTTSATHPMRIATQLNLVGPGINTGGFQPVEFVGALPTVDVETLDAGSSLALNFFDTGLVLAGQTFGSSGAVNVEFVGLQGSLSLTALP